MERKRIPEEPHLLPVPIEVAGIADNNHRAGNSPGNMEKPYEDSPLDTPTELPATSTVSHMNAPF